MVGPLPASRAFGETVLLADPAFDFALWVGPLPRRSSMYRLRSGRYGILGCKNYVVAACRSDCASVLCDCHGPLQKSRRPAAPENSASNTLVPRLGSTPPLDGLTEPRPREGECRHRTRALVGNATLIRPRPKNRSLTTSLRSQTPSDQRRPAKPGTLGLERRLYLEHFVNGSSEGA